MTDIENTELKHLMAQTVFDMIQSFRQAGFHMDSDVITTALIGSASYSLAMLALEVENTPAAQGSNATEAFAGMMKHLLMKGEIITKNADALIQAHKADKNK